MRIRPIYDSAVKHPVWLRAMTALWALWFTTALVEPAGFMACPMHSGMGHVMETAGPMAMPAPAQVVPHEHLMSGAAQMTSEQEVSKTAQNDATKAPSEEHHSCTCLGQCCTMAPAESAQPVVALFLTPLLQTAAPRFEHTDRIPERAAYALPFANGPPAIV